ncbi:hypothetical protein GCM10008985_30170 [Halococcus dombrowskii]|uniref:Winged helix-turn helix domain-containing protein n=1 Tax=Halococcus dombrowskii TaxID=179637 RepID=A0AAV3SJI3_HALDO
MEQGWTRSSDPELRGRKAPPPLNFNEDEQDELIELLRDGLLWKLQGVQHFLMDEFDVEYHPDYLGTFLRDPGLSYAKPRPKRPNQPENPDEILDEDEQPHNKRMGDDEEGRIVDEDVCTDGGTVIGFLMLHTHSRTIIRDVSGTSTIHTSNDR